MGSENGKYEHEDYQSGTPAKRKSAIHDLWSDRIVGIMRGACIPVILLFIPLLNKYFDNTKEVRILELQRDGATTKALYDRIDFLASALINCQEANKGIASDAKFKTERLLECKK